MSRFRFIAAEKARHPVARLCRLLEVSTSGLYAWGQRQPAPRTQADRALTDRIRTIYDRSRCTYGAPRVHAELRAAGQRVGRKRVARLMRTAQLVGRVRRRFRRTTIPDPMTQVVDLVQRHFNAAAPDQLWVADITYVRTWEGWLYLAMILDAFSRRVVGWALAEHLRTTLTLEALEMALVSRRPRPGLIHHTDRGCQYTAEAYSNVLVAHGIAPSLGQPGTCWDNAMAESFFATLKTELLHRCSWPTRRQARTAIFEFIEGFYNRQRRHSALGYQSPAEFELNHRAAA